MTASASSRDRDGVDVGEDRGDDLRAGPVGLAAATRSRRGRGFRRELQAVPGVADALDQIALPTCIASGGSHEKMELTLGLTGLWDRFDGRIFSASEVPRPKPAPDLFLRAAAQSGVDLARCLVVEGQPVRSGRCEGGGNAVPWRRRPYAPQSSRELWCNGPAGTSLIAPGPPPRFRPPRPGPRGPGRSTPWRDSPGSAATRLFEASGYVK